MVHCQGGSNPPSPAPPLVLGTPLPRFVSGKFSRLLAQTPGRISRRSVCLRSALPPPRPWHRAESRPGRGGGCWGAAAGGVRVSPPGVTCIAPRPGRGGTSPGSAPIPAAALRMGTCRTVQRLSMPCPSLSHQPPFQDGKRRDVSKESGSCPPPLPPELSWSEARRARWLL